MNTFTKAGISIGTAAGLGGTGYGMYSALRTRSYSELLDGTLLSTKDQENKDNWTSRLTKLNKAKDDDLVDSLKELKNKTNPAKATWEDLRDWCKDNINNANKGEKDKEFQNIQSFCAYSIKEKLKNPIKDIEGGTNPLASWALGYAALKKIPVTDLDEKLKVAKGKAEQEAVKDIKTWCTENFEESYKGENNQAFKNASKICVTNLPS